MENAADVAGYEVGQGQDGHEGHEAAADVKRKLQADSGAVRGGVYDIGVRYLQLHFYYAPGFRLFRLGDKYFGHDQRGRRRHYGGRQEVAGYIGKVAHQYPDVSGHDAARDGSHAARHYG